MTAIPEERTLPVDVPLIRLDQFLADHVPELTRSRLKRSILNGDVSVNDKEETKPSLKVKEGDTVILRVPPPEFSEALAEDIPLQVLYEDEDIIVLNKKPGMVVHPAPGHPKGTLVNALLHHCGDLSGIGGVLRPGIVHRLDKETSGVMVAAKNDAAHQHLTHQLAERTMTRIYVAMVMGSRLEGSGSFDTLYGRAPNDRFRYSSKVRTGKTATTHWKILARGTICSLVQVRLESGRTHQIRVHFSDHGHPVVGDPLYGKSLKGFDTSRNPKEGRAISSHKRQALHALILELVHPRTEEKHRFFAPVHPDMHQAAQAAFGANIWEEIKEELGFENG